MKDSEHFLGIYKSSNLSQDQLVGLRHEEAALEEILKMFRYELQKVELKPQKETADKKIVDIEYALATTTTAVITRTLALKQNTLHHEEQEKRWQEMWHANGNGDNNNDNDGRAIAFLEKRL